jgi:hypothetical protein
MRSNIRVATLVLTVLALEGCHGAAPTAPQSRLPVYSTDMAGKAASCTVSPVKPVADRNTPATITTGGGGWCGILVQQNGAPYAAGLLTQEAHDGKVYIHSVGDNTRIDYTPRPGRVGPDSFTVKLIPGDAVIQVSVNTPTGGK